MINMHLTYLATCFSKTPVNTPMWAHYADDFKGYSIEISEQCLINYLKSINITTNLCDIEYRNTPSQNLCKKLAYASIRCKPRDIYQFENAIIYYAYFIKQKCWKYEQERRLILPETFFNTNSKNLLLCPINLITSIIVGNKASDELKLKLKNLSQKYQINYFEIHPSRVSLAPFLTDNEKQTYKFVSKKGIKKVKYYCPKCNEPINKNQELCSWCSITKTDKDEAKRKNAFRILDHVGLLQDYIMKMDEITKSIYNKREI